MSIVSRSREVLMPWTANSASSRRKRRAYRSSMPGSGSKARLTLFRSAYARTTARPSDSRRECFGLPCPVVDDAGPE